MLRVFPSTLRGSASCVPSHCHKSRKDWGGTYRFEKVRVVSPKSAVCGTGSWGAPPLGGHPELKSTRLEIIGVADVREAVTRARGSTGRGGGRRGSIVGLAYCVRLIRISCASGVLSELEARSGGLRQPLSLVNSFAQCLKK